MAISYDEIFGQILPMVEVSEEKKVQEGLESENSGGKFSEKQKETIEKYKIYESSKESIEVKFTGISNNNNFFAMDGDVKLILSYSAMSNDMKTKMGENGNREKALSVIEKPIKVMVTGFGFNKEIPVVFVSCVKIENMRRDKAKETFAYMIDHHDNTKVPALIARIDYTSQQILLNLCGYGIKGICSFKDWSNAPLSDAQIDSIKVGMKVDVRVSARIKKKLKNDGTINRVNTGAYRCVRKDDADPFKDLERKFPVGTVVLAKAVRCMKNFCFMQIDGFDQVQVMCFYQDLRDGGHENSAEITVEKVYVGHVYSIIINQCDSTRRRFRGRILNEITSVVEEGGL